MADPSQVRYALYYTPPPDSPLWRFGCAVIGYDSVLGCDVPLALPEGWSTDDWRAATTEPRRYGFHATLKAPFRLAAGSTEDDLLEAVRTFSKGNLPVPLGGLRVAQIGSFVAVVPEVQGKKLENLAADVVTAFEPFRAPLTAEDRSRRKPELLSNLERSYLDCYGYPYVLDAFRFHMTLSGPLAPECIDWTRKALELDFLPVVARPTCVDRIALCAQPEPRRALSCIGDGRAFAMTASHRGAAQAPPDHTSLPKGRVAVDRPLGVRPCALRAGGSRLAGALTLADCRLPLPCLRTTRFASGVSPCERPLPRFRFGSRDNFDYQSEVLFGSI